MQPEDQRLSLHYITSKTITYLKPPKSRTQFHATSKVTPSTNYCSKIKSIWTLHMASKVSSCDNSPKSLLVIICVHLFIRIK